MEQGDKFGLVGLIIGGAGLGNIVAFFIYNSIPFFASFDFILIINLYIALITGIACVPFSIIGISMNGSKMGIIGLILGSVALLLALLALFL